MPASAAIYGCQGMQLAPEEREFFRDAQPFGFILVARNCETPVQVPAPVLALGRIVLDGHLAGGVLPVLKHIPGHGRALADSHLALPKVPASAKQLSAHDFVTFRGLNHAPIAMTAHVVYQAIDANRPATTSARVVHSVIRGEIGFRGLLISDDLSIAALQGPQGNRTKASSLAE